MGGKATGWMFFRKSEFGGFARKYFAMVELTAITEGGNE